ncbi:sortase [Patescibacteria group bacterium]|nr:sortase [Patescibacteria group bacterium]
MHSPRKLFGNALMAFSLFLIVFIYYPIIVFYLFPSSKKSLPSDASFYIDIPKINIKTPIVPSVDPFNEKEYKLALEKGVAQARGTVLPGEKGTTFLFAHSSDLPWRITRYNIAFVRLPELAMGDLITIYRNGKIYAYKVSDKKTVWPNEVGYLLDTKKTQLILQTCVPIGTSFQRLLVFAEPIQ